MALAKVLTLICIALFGFLGLLLITSKVKRSLANTILGTFFLCWAFNFLDGYLLLDEFYLKYPQLALWEDALIFTYGPLIYFYVKALFKDIPPWKPQHFWHLIPFFLLLITLVAVYHMQPLDYQRGILQDILALDQVSSIFPITMMIIVHILIYFVASFRRVKRYQDLLKDLYATFNIQWLSNTLIFLIVIVIVSLLISVMQFYGGKQLFETGLIVLNIILLVFISQILFKAFEEPELFALEKRAYRLTISKDKQLQISKAVSRAMEKDKMYLDPDVTLMELARRIQASPREASQVINDRFQQNFFDLINSRRIQEAQNILKSSTDPKLTVSEVMYQVGFNSKSSFNTQFKKKTGITPSEFKKLHS